MRPVPREPLLPFQTSLSAPPCYYASMLAAVWVPGPLSSSSHEAFSESTPCCHQGIHTQGSCAYTWHQRWAGCPGGLSKAAGSRVTQSLGSYRAG